jgi:putative ABC transport system ATP-binding protein
MEKHLSSLISLNQVNKIYHSNANEYHALKGIDLQIELGEMTAIMGASGSGKSTLMNIIGFLDHCTSGSYFFSGQDVSSLEKKELAGIRNKKIGFVFQSFFLLPRLDALQNVMLPLFYRNEKKDIARAKALQMLTKVGMDHLSHHKPNQLSGGQQQRVAIARALVGDPDLILADEPTGALDSKTGKDVMDLFLQLNSVENRTIIIVTHDELVSHQCRRTVMIKDGCVQ